jgi:hypothetical protein
VRTYPVDGEDGLHHPDRQGGTRIVGDGLQYTNECRVDPSGQYLFVNETFGAGVTRFRIAADGSLRDRETIAEFRAATSPTA